MDFKLGQIVFFRSWSFYSTAIGLYNIKTFGKRGWTHLGIVTKVNKHTVNIHEAIGRGFTKSQFLKTEIEDGIKAGNNCIKEVRSQYDLVDIAKYAKKYEGTPYSWFDIAMIGLHFLTGFRFGGDTNALICGEAIAKILYDASNHDVNMADEFGIHWSRLTPMQVFNSLYVKF